MSDKKYREFWINSFYDSPEEHAGWKFRRAWDGWTEIIASSDSELIHTVEMSAFNDLQSKLQALEEQNRVLVELVKASLNLARLTKEESIECYYHYKVRARQALASLKGEG